MRTVEAPPLVVHDNGICGRACSHHPLREDEVEMALASSLSVATRTKLRSMSSRG